MLQTLRSLLFGSPNPSLPFRALGVHEVTRITTQEAISLQKGDVVLVKSTGVPQLGNHFIVVTGPPVMKPHGLRPQTISIPATFDTLLNQYASTEKVVLLKLKAEAASEFRIYHNITFENKEIRVSATMNPIVYDNQIID